MTATQKLAHKRLTLLQLAKKLGNVSKACRMHKVSRSQFYEYKRSFQTHGLDGLIDKLPIPASHPSQLPEKARKRIIDLSLKHPDFGQQRIADQLALEGLVVCMKLTIVSPALIDRRYACLHLFHKSYFRTLH